MVKCFLHYTIGINENRVFIKETPNSWDEANDNVDHRIMIT